VKESENHLNGLDFVYGKEVKMSLDRTCDICGRSETEVQPSERRLNKPFLHIDGDGLWLCGTCQKRINSKPEGSEAQNGLVEALKRLIGISAGAICRTLELPDRPPYLEVQKAAAEIGYDQDRYMSAWLFATQWLDGTTVWRKPDGSAQAIVSPDGSIWIEMIQS